MKPAIRNSSDGPAPAPSQLASVILAAGRSARLGRHKALLQISPTEQAWERILNQHLDCGLAPHLVVSQELATYLSPEIPEAVVLINRRPEKGPLSSLQLALKQLQSTSGVLMHPVDHPLVATSTLLRLTSLHLDSPDRILIPTSNGEKGHPVVFGSSFLPDLLAAPLEEGANFVVRRHAVSIRLVEVEDEGILANLNSPEDVRYWRSRGHWLGLP